MSACNEFQERNRKLIEAAQIIKDFCNNHTCGDCPFHSNKCGKFYPCEFLDNVPWHWDLPEGKGYKETL